MPLPKPQLDHRRFDQLVDEARALLPRAAPNWTDYNTSDPGMTLIELYAWISEMALYGLDRVSDEATRAFLRLVGVQVQPARAAEAIVLVAPLADIDLPVGLQLGDSAQTLTFETTHALTASAARLVSLVDGEGNDATAAQGTDAGWLPFGRDAARDSAWYLGFDRVLANPGAELSAYVWTHDPEGDALMRARLIEEYERSLALREAYCPSTLRGLVPWWQHHDVRVIWEYWSAGGTWRALDNVSDRTRALTLSGPVRWRAPADHVAGGGPDPWQFWIRARLQRGAYACTPRLAHVGWNAVHAVHAARVPDVALGVSAGHADAEYDIGVRPVFAGSTALTATLPSGVDGPWREVANWDDSGAQDRDYVLDAARGCVRFGNGWRGVVPPAQAALNMSLRVGGGSAGNAEAGRLERWRDHAHNQALLPGWSALWPSLQLSQPDAARGGRDAESLKDSVARALALQAEISCAVTVDDYAELARAVPGVSVARAFAIAEYLPELPCARAEGRIAVVIVPRCPGPAPMPSPGMLRAVSAYLELRRAPTTLVRVLAPEYTRVRVTATLRARAGVDIDALRRTAQSAIDAFLHPLTGGPDQLGWPLGRTVYRSEMQALLGALDGVACVEALGLLGATDRAPRCENLELCPHQLIVPGAHRLRVLGARVQRIVDRSIAHECP